MSDFGSLRMEKVLERRIPDTEKFTIELTRRDSIAHVSKTIQKARARSEWFGSAPKEISDGRTFV